MLFIGRVLRLADLSVAPLLFQGGHAITGLDTGYADLNAMTRGFQPGELLILAAINLLAPVQRILGTGRLPRQAWLAMIPFFLAILLVEEGRKWLVRRSVRAPA